MGFLSYNLQYYDTALRAFENSSPTAEQVYLAKQLLKFAEDIAFEIMFSGKGIPFDFFEGLEDAKIWLLT